MRTTPEHPAQEPRSIEAHNLLATKLHVPRIRDDNLSRPRLVEMLEDGLRHEVILVCTPAGFGKTTLLGSWAAITDQPVAWLTLDADDNDPARFWRYVTAAVDNAGAGTTDQVLPLVAPSSLASGEAIVTALVNAMTEEVEDFVLVLDDYHSIESSTIHEAVSHLLTHLPLGCGIGRMIRQTGPARPAHEARMGRCDITSRP
jgi:LuxR family maltose regulon positive regulatory protein